MYTQRGDGRREDERERKRDRVRRQQHHDSPNDERCRCCGVKG